MLAERKHSSWQTSIRNRFQYTDPKKMGFHLSLDFRQKDESKREPNWGKVRVGDQVVFFSRFFTFIQKMILITGMLQMYLRKGMIST